MIACPSCGENFDTTLKYNFCMSCTKQIRCLSCKEILVPEKDICLVCGTPLITRSNDVSSQMNKYSFEDQQEEKSSLKKIELTLTDKAVENLAPFLGTQFAIPRIETQEPVVIKQSNRLLASMEESYEKAESEDEDEHQLEESDQDSKASEQKETTEASHYFSLNNNGVLTSKHPDYKGESKKEQFQRFILLYTWGYNEIVQKAVPSESHLKDAASQNSILIKNYKLYLPDILRQYLLKTGDTFQLNPGGKKQVEKILADMRNEDFDGYSYWEIKSRKRTGINHEDKENLKKWVQMTSRFDQIDIRRLSEGYEYVVVALYDLTKELKVMDAAKPILAFEYLKLRYKTVNLTKAQFGRLFSRDYHSDKFEKREDGLYYLTTRGEAIAESLLKKLTASSAN